jgi:hypothetical protein
VATTTTNNGWTIPQSTDLVSQGATAIATLGNNIDASVGTGLKAWTAYTPTITGWTLGNGTVAFTYAQLGKIVYVRGIITSGTTTTYGSPSFTLPVTAKTSGVGVFPNFAYLKAAGTNYFGFGYLNTTTAWVVSALNAASTYLTTTTVSTTVPATWTTGDQVVVAFAYEAA